MVSAMIALIALLAPPPALLAPAPNEEPLGLEAIAQVESCGGRFLDHPLVTTGMHAGTRAGGAYAVMPLTFKDVVSRNEDLRQRYGNYLSATPRAITKALNVDEQMSKTVARRYYEEILKLVGNDHVRAALAWYRGPGRALRMRWSDVVKDPYVVDYMTAYRIARNHRNHEEWQRFVIASAPTLTPMVISGSGDPRVALGHE